MPLLATAVAVLAAFAVTVILGAWVLARPLESREPGSAPPGTLYAVQVILYDCPEGCGVAGYYSIWGGRPQGTLRRLRGSSPGEFATPVPAMVAPNRRWLVHADRNGSLVLRRLGTSGRRVGAVQRLLPMPNPDDWLEPLVAWSPDSRRLALASDGALWTMPRDGSVLRRIPLPSRVVPVADVDEYQAPSWSRTGRIAFVGQTRKEYNRALIRSRIYAVRPDGSGLAALTHPRRGIADTAPAWSSRGRFLTYVRDAYMAQGILMLRDLKAQTSHVLDRHGGPSAWSPDDRWIAYDSEDGAFIRRSDGTGQRRDLDFGSSAIDSGFLSHFDWARR